MFSSVQQFKNLCVWFTLRIPPVLEDPYELMKLWTWAKLD